MKRNTKSMILAFIGIIGFTAISITPVFAADCEENEACKTDLCQCDCVPKEVREASGCEGNTNTDLQTVITNILKAVILIAGLVSVIYIIIGGVNYMTSSGDAAKTQKAKNTILYALIGLIICALSFAIVNWTIDAVNNANTTTNVNNPDEQDTPN